MASVKVCKASELQPGMATRVVLGDVPVAVFNADGEYFAIGDTCSHEESSLSEGYLEDTTVECAKHGAAFDLKTGKNLTLPATRPVPSFGVRIEGEDLYVETRS